MELEEALAIIWFESVHFTDVETEVQTLEAQRVTKGHHWDWKPISQVLPVGCGGNPAAPQPCPPSGRNPSFPKGRYLC